ncbi:MAG: hypothetical protein H0X54_04865 [Propionibacteriales bacterium]|nr:hypothetical protein [Propionibacteriales bacterium]
MLDRMNPQRRYPTLLSRVLLVSTFALATAACSQEVDPSDSSSPDDRVTRSSDTPGPTTPAGTDDTTDTTDTDDTGGATPTCDDDDSDGRDDGNDGRDDDSDGRDDDSDGRDDDSDGQRDC